jgi:tryptophan-rich sensory protein
MNNTIISLFSILLVTYLGGRFTKSNVNNSWYNCIKPNITPPNYVFPIVWTILYILLIKIFKDILDSKNKLLITLFVINLLLNIVWTYFYFGQKDIKNAFITILLILATSIIILYKNKDNKLLYLPYVLWIGFATYLNYLSIDKLKIC